MGIDGWVLISVIATALMAAFSSDPRHPVRSLRRRAR